MTATTERRLDYEASCSEPDVGRMIRDIMARVGDKWSVLVIGTLADGALRFSDLQARIPGVSHRMLTVTLRGLERDGLVTRTAYGEVPPRVEYDLTAVGRTFIGPASAVASWAIAQREAIAAARAAYDSAHV